MGDLDLYVMHGSFGAPESTTQTASLSVQPFCRAHNYDREADRQRYSICSNRL